MKLYNTQKLNEVMENIKPKTILFFYVKEYYNERVLPSTEIDFVKSIITIDGFARMGASVVEAAKKKFGNFKIVVHCNRFKLVQNADTNEWTIYNDENTDYEFLYAFEKADNETYKLLGTVEDFYFQESLRWRKNKND